MKKTTTSNINPFSNNTHIPTTIYPPTITYPDNIDWNPDQRVQWIPDNNIYKTITTTTTPYSGNINVSDVVIDGESLKSKLKEICNRLLIIERDVKMEEKYPELAEAYNNYQSILEGLLALEALIGEENLA